MEDSKQLHPVLCQKKIIKKDNNQMNQVRKSNKWKNNDNLLYIRLKFVHPYGKNCFLKLNK